MELINTQALGTMVGGGGLIYFASKSSQHVYSGWQWKARKEHLAAMTVPIYTMGVGYNAFENQSPVHENPDFRSAFEDNWARFLERSSVVGLRESYSIDKMKALFPSPRFESMYSSVVLSCVASVVGSLCETSTPHSL